MPQANKKYSDRSHARIYGDWEQLPAWFTLSLAGRSILTVLLMDYRLGINFVPLSDREAARRGNCARPTAAKALQELQEKGWIGVARVGKMTGRKAVRGSAYYLTKYPEEIGYAPSHAYKKWRPAT